MTTTLESQVDGVGPGQTVAAAVPAGAATIETNAGAAANAATGPDSGDSTPVVGGEKVAAVPGDPPVLAAALNVRRPGPLWAPNGVPWPPAAGLQGYEILHGGGRSSVTLDNAANHRNMWVKLFAHEAAGATPVRHIFLPAHGRFTMAGVSAGTYDVRYMNLWDSSLVGTEPFTLTETEAAGRIHYDQLTITLYKAPDGNMRTHGLGRDQF